MAHFRFFAWTIGVLPMPADWREGARAQRLLELSERAHERGAITRDEQMALDDMVCDAYALSHEQRAAIRELDSWFNGAEVKRT